MEEKELQSFHSFYWDYGNLEKNWAKHNVRRSEIEETFFNKPLLLIDAVPKPPNNEKRYIIQGITNSERRLFIVFTVRGDKIRPISARDMSRKERKYYEENS
ncbi:MAG: BrnT family toxin [Fibrobacteres bacterium]|nr:BrnT family toxin [Fibrobacterota bacterium]